MLQMCGPTGIGFLYGKSELLNAMPPFLGKHLLYWNILFVFAKLMVTIKAIEGRDLFVFNHFIAISL